MTRVTANLILLIMAGVWAYLSIESGMLQPVSDNFWKVGLLIAAGEGVAGTGLTSAVGKKFTKKDEKS